MRIVAVADTHLFTKDLVVPAGDVFVHAGDLCRGGWMKELERAAAWIRSLPHRRKIVVAGNHDWCFARPSEREAARALLGDGVTYLEDAEATIEDASEARRPDGRPTHGRGAHSRAGVRFYGSPWQPAFNDWAFNLPRGAALAEKWARIPDGLDVLITHGPPAGFGDATSVDRREGCSDLLDRVRVAKPRLHLFGHIHESGGAWTEGATTFVNCTTWECERAPTVIDLTRDAVTCVAVPPARNR
jgi:3',5'-cyclic AMP phosphodiesterase CpdA